MGDFTKIAYAEAKSERPFSRQLAMLMKGLHLPMPMFKGRAMAPLTPGMDRWEIQTIMLADPLDDGSVNDSYIGIYPDWNRGVEMAMLECLARLCELHYDKLPEGSPFCFFGKRSQEGDTLTMDEREEFITVKQLEDLDYVANKMEDMLNIEMYKCDMANGQVHARELELQGTYAVIANLEQDVAGLQ
jgi:hypothetical protein